MTRSFQYQHIKSTISGEIMAAKINFPVIQPIQNQAIANPATTNHRAAFALNVEEGNYNVSF
jgi:hypothetical protein